MKIKDKQLEFCLKASKEELAKALGAEAYTEGTQRFWYRSNESKVLAVAHMDFRGKTFYSKANINGRWYVFSPALDDRLGVYIIGYLLPSQGITPDILLTDNEETGNSSARIFEIKDHNYNWMFSFDRKGTGAVLYEYDTPELREMLKRHGGWDTEHGSYSCIRELEDLGIAGINFGTAYEDEHTDMCRADINTIKSQVEKFKIFWGQMVGTKLTYTPKPAVSYTWTPYAGSRWKSDAGMFEPVAFRSLGERIEAETVISAAAPALQTLIYKSPEEEALERKASWWCDCPTMYTHPYEQDHCDICGAARNDYTAGGWKLPKQSKSKEKDTKAEEDELDICLSEYFPALEKEMLDEFTKKALEGLQATTEEIAELGDLILEQLDKYTSPDTNAYASLETLKALLRAGLQFNRSLEEL